MTQTLDHKDLAVDGLLDLVDLLKDVLHRADLQITSLECRLDECPPVGELTNENIDFAIQHGHRMGCRWLTERV